MIDRAFLAMLTATMLWGAACGADDKVPADAGTDAANGGESAPAVHHLATSATHTCAIRQAGLFCWGANGLGELGNGTTTDSRTAVRAEAAGADVVEVAAHSGRTCVRRSTGEVACLGANDHGQIGDGTRDDVLIATAAIGIDNAHQLAIDDNSTCVVHGAKRGVSCWGESSKLSPDQGSIEPVAIEGLSGVKLLRVGAFASYCALDTQGSVLCWRMEQGHWTTPTKAPLTGVRTFAMPHADYVCAKLEVGRIVCQNIAAGMQDLRVELPESEGALELEAGSGGLVVCAVDSTKTWTCWNVPSFVFASMGVDNVAAVFPFFIGSEVQPRELVIAGFRMCVLREDQTVACGDGSSSDSASSLLNEMRIDVSIQVEGLPQ